MTKKFLYNLILSVAVFSQIVKPQIAVAMNDYETFSYECNDGNNCFTKDDVEGFSQLQKIAQKGLCRLSLFKELPDGKKVEFVPKKHNGPKQHFVRVVDGPARELGGMVFHLSGNWKRDQLNLIWALWGGDNWRYKLEQYVKVVKRSIRTPLGQELLVNVGQRFGPKILDGLFKDIIRYPLDQQVRACWSFVEFFDSPIKFELFYKPFDKVNSKNVHTTTCSFNSIEWNDTIHMKPSYSDFLDDSISNESFSNATDYEHSSLNTKKSQCKISSETESNQDTNGTTGPKKDSLKVKTSTEPPLLLTTSISSNSQESFNESTISIIQKSIVSSFKFSSEDHEILLNNDGNRNNAPNTETSKAKSNGEESNFFLVHDSITYHIHKPKKVCSKKRKLGISPQNLEEDN